MARFSEPRSDSSVAKDCPIISGPAPTSVRISKALMRCCRRSGVARLPFSAREACWAASLNLLHRRSDVVNASGWVGSKSLLGDILSVSWVMNGRRIRDIGVYVKQIPLIRIEPSPEGSGSTKWGGSSPGR